MSSTGGTAVVTGGQNQYYCHQCDAIVSIPLSSSSPDLICPTCSGGFLEEYETPSPNLPNPQPTSFFSLSSSSGRRHSTSSSGDLIHFPFGNDDRPFNPADLTAALYDLAGAAGAGGSGSRSGSESVETEVFNPMVFLQNYLNEMRTGVGGIRGGGNIQFVIENNGGGRIAETGFQLPANLGDYFVGPGLEQLIQQLAENDPNRYGTPPASKAVVKKLPDVVVTDELLVSDDAQCAVCMDMFELRAKVKQMPCNHIYHADCILPWLELHNSCPVCRYELPTDDPDYEHHAASRQRGESSVRVDGSSGTSSSTGGNGGSSEENSQTRDEGGFRVQLPWPFSSFGSGSYGSNSGNSNNDGENSQGRSHQ